MYPQIAVLVYTINTTYMLQCSIRDLNSNFYVQITDHEGILQLLVCIYRYVTHDIIVTFPCRYGIPRMNSR